MPRLTPDPTFVVYEKAGLTFLRRAWINSDQFWAAAFILAGVATLIS